MAEGNGNDRISVSRETLRAELSELKLDLIERLASKADVNNLNSRVASIEMHGSPQMNSVLSEIHDADRRLIALEKTSAKSEALASYKRWSFGLAISATVGLLGAVATLVWLAVGG